MHTPVTFRLVRASVCRWVADFGSQDMIDGFGNRLLLSKRDIGDLQ